MPLRKLKIIKQQITPIIKKYPIDYVAIFGSYARGDENKKSDLDLLVNFSEPVTYFDVIDIENKIAKKIKIKKVDLVTLKAMSPYIKKHVTKDLKVVYDER